MTQKYFSDGGFRRNTFFIDSDGKKFFLENAKVIRRSWHIAYLFGPSPAIIVDVSVSKPVQLTFEEIKALVIELIIKNRWFHQGGDSKEKFLKEFQGLQSIAELMENISFYGEWQG